MTEQIHRAKINKSIDGTNTQNEDKQLRSMYLFCHLTCLSSLCVFVLSFDLFIVALCICSVICQMTEQIHRAKINKSIKVILKLPNSEQSYKGKGYTPFGLNKLSSSLPLSCIIEITQT
jgi:GTP:adenosylcobinamide-phosphate guanylyltransferase